MSFLSKAINNVWSGGSFLGGSGFDFKGGFTPGNLADMFNGKTAIDYQNQLNIQNWNMQNEYNTPAAQMQRFKDAGLNPNLIYGQTNMAGSVGSVSAPKTPSLNDVMAIFSQVMAIKQIGAQIANLRQQNSNLQSQDTLLGSQADLVNAEAERYRYETQWYKDRGLPPGSGVDPWERRGMFLLDLFKRFVRSSGGDVRLQPPQSTRNEIQYIYPNASAYGHSFYGY